MELSDIKNNFLNLNNLQNESNLQNYNVIPRPVLQHSIINRPYKVIVPISNPVESTKFKIDLNETFKDVISVKLLNGIFIGQINNNTTNEQILYVTIFIDELKKNYGPNGSFDTSFATLDYDFSANIDNNANNHLHNIYKNNFDTHQDIKYFDPPLNSLSTLNITIKENIEEFENTKGKLEFLIETKDKLRVY